MLVVRVEVWPRGDSRSLTADRGPDDRERGTRRERRARPSRSSRGSVRRDSSRSEDRALALVARAIQAFVAGAADMPASPRSQSTDAPV